MHHIGGYARITSGPLNGFPETGKSGSARFQMLDIDHENHGEIISHHGLADVHDIVPSSENAEDFRHNFRVVLPRNRDQPAVFSASVLGPKTAVTAFATESFMGVSAPVSRVADDFGLPGNHRFQLSVQVSELHCDDFNGGESILVGGHGATSPSSRVFQSNTLLERVPG